MSLVTTDSANYTAIAGAIREKLGVETAYKPEDMAAAIASISGGIILRGTTPPSVSLGSDGDYYEQSFPIASGVNFVEFLRSSGTEYIETGIYATQDTDIFVRCKPTNNNGVTVCGVRTGAATSASKCLHIGFPSLSAARVVKSSSVISQENYGLSIPSNAACNIQTKTCQIVAGKTAILNAGPSYKFSPLISEFVSDYTIPLFGGRLGNQTVTPQASIIYRLVIFEAGAAIADYLPCLDSNNVACVWDNVGREYVYNAGTGDFIAGEALSTPPDELEPALWYKENGAWIVVGW